MRVFLSYAREDRARAETIRSALHAAGFDCFLDTTSLPFGQEYNARISQAVAGADLFVFLVSGAALEPGSYALTELSFAENKWRNPAGYVLPVVPADFDAGRLPAYLRPVNALPIRGNIEAQIVDWVRQRVEKGGGGGEETPELRLARWLRLNQRPFRKARKLPARYLASVVVGVGFVGFGILASSLFSEMGPAPAGVDAFAGAMTIVPILIGALVVLSAIVQTIRGAAGTNAVGALVLDRSERKHGITVHLLLADGSRKGYDAVGRSASNVYAGEIGWAFVKGGMLLDFEAGPRATAAER